MRAFTAEQQEFLRLREQKYLSYISALHEAIEEYGYRVAAMANVLFTKGLSTPQELQAAEDQIRAAVIVEKVVNPEVRAAVETLQRVLEDP